MSIKRFITITLVSVLTITLFSCKEDVPYKKELCGLYVIEVIHEDNKTIDAREEGCLASITLEENGTAIMLADGIHKASWAITGKDTLTVGKTNMFYIFSDDEKRIGCKKGDDFIIFKKEE